MRRTETEMQFRSRGVRGTPPMPDQGGRGQRRLKNLNLYLDLSNEKGCKMCRIQPGSTVEGVRGARGTGGFSRRCCAYGRSQQVRECKFYDQSGGLIRKRCPSVGYRRCCLFVVAYRPSLVSVNGFEEPPSCQLSKLLLVSMIVGNRAPGRSTLAIFRLTVVIKEVKHSTNFRRVN